MNEPMARQPQRLSFTQTVHTTGYQKMITATLKDPKAAARFTAAIISAVKQTPALEDCTPDSIVSCAFLGESLGLSPSPQLGQFYLVPFQKRGGPKEATFQLGYRGIVQLAMRTGEYKRMNVTGLKQGELLSWNPLTEEIDVSIIEDDELRESLPTTGYVASFELLNGFKKTIYWSKEKVINHADKYSQAFSKNATTGRYPKVSFADYEAGKVPKGTEWLYSSPWYTSFDGMAYKTLLRHILSKWGIMSAELQHAVDTDYTSESAAVSVHDVQEVARQAFEQPQQQPQIAQAPAPELQAPTEEPEREQAPAPAASFSDL